MRTYRNSLTKCRASSFGGSWDPGWQEGWPSDATPLSPRLVTHSVCSKEMMLDSSWVSRNLQPSTGRSLPRPPLSVTLAGAGVGGAIGQTLPAAAAPGSGWQAGPSPSNSTCSRPPQPLKVSIQLKTGSLPRKGGISTGGPQLSSLAGRPPEVPTREYGFYCLFPVNTKASSRRHGLHPTLFPPDTSHTRGAYLLSRMCKIHVKRL